MSCSLTSRLPGMSGIEVAAELRRDPEQSGCVLVAVSGHGKESLPSPSPFDQHFVKPVDPASLLDYLSEVEASADTAIPDDDGRRLSRPVAIPAADEKKSIGPAPFARARQGRLVSATSPHRTDAGALTRHHGWSTPVLFVG